MRSFTLLFFLLTLNCFSDLSCTALLLEDEVRILDTIALKLQNRIWIPNQRKCQARMLDETVPMVNNITCNCTFNNNTVCHVTNIQFKGLNLRGVLPTDFLNLTYLQEIDLTFNYINGSIPTAFGQFRNLKTLGLMGNRISGSIPSEMGNIATLEELILEDNEFGGPLPRSLGRLSNLKRLLLSANKFTGMIPDTFFNLKNLEDFRIDGNQISGKIPNLIGNWTKIKRFDLQGTSMEGPIPSTIAHLKNLTELRISDLKGSTMRFPFLQDMKSMQTLILRNCSIVDQIPSYIKDMFGLWTLDLSFNQLTGPITIPSLRLNYLFLSHNSLNGTLPTWMQASKQNIDISYNNLMLSPRPRCMPSTLNLVSSLSPSIFTNDSADWCLKKDLPCPGKPQYHSLFINCGGQQMSFKRNVYEEDQNPMGSSFFYFSSDKWAYSSTGLFMNNGSASFLASNINVTDADIYKTARLAPTSLKYYGLCLRNGSYKVRLHFAELMFTDDNTFRSLGRRIFDVAIQGNLVLKDFNIVEEAEGVGMGIYRDFDVDVNGSTLEIHLYWAGKGTLSIPNLGVHGPLLSAIAVTPNFSTGDGGLSVGAIVGIVATSCVVILLILVVLRMRGCLGGKTNDKELGELELQTGYFTLRQIKAATRNFDSALKIGEGGFGSVYKGVLSDNTVIAVKQLSSKSKQGNREFINEIGMISALQHPNLVKLYGCCIEGNQLLLVYEYMENNNLANALFGHEEQLLNLDWLTRRKICLGIARGLSYLHEESRLKIVHRDIKATNVLLDKDLNAKISDFGLAKLDEEENTHISTRIAGTIGYMAPEYALRGYLTDKADVYSYGVVILELVSGKSNTKYRPKEDFVYLLDWAYVLYEQGNLLELVDSSLGSNYSQAEAMKMLNLALLCTSPSPTLRPSMSSIVSMLEGKIEVQAPIVKRRAANEDLRFRAFETPSRDSETHITTSSRGSQMSNDLSGVGSWIDSSLQAESKDEIVSLI